MSDNNGGDLEILYSFDIDVPEPSGLSFGESRDVLYTVSDRTSKIYKLSLDGKVLGEIECDADDLEGVAYDKSDNSLWIADEGKRKLKKVDLQGETIESFKLKIKSKHKNSGIEGLTIDNKNNNLLCLNEKKPGLLIKTDKQGNILEKHKLKFAKDYSGIFYDEHTDKLWVVSDKSMTISRLDIQGNVEESYQTQIESMEGIAVDTQNMLIYVVSDELEKLFVFSLKVKN